MFGITPAGAGKTARQICNISQSEDHPRRCGENNGSPPHTAYEGGSPPQVRGKPSELLSDEIIDRITPAGAGKTPSLSDVPITA